MLLQQTRKETLNQILGVLRALTLAPDKNVQRVPVSLAQFCQRLVGLRRVGLSGQQDLAPVGGPEPAVPPRVFRAPFID